MKADYKIIKVFGFGWEQEENLNELEMFLNQGYIIERVEELGNAKIFIIFKWVKEDEKV